MASLQNTSFDQPQHYRQGLPSEEERLERFKYLDIDKDGRVGFGDLSEAVQRMGLPHIPNRIEKYLEKSDSSCSLDFAKFVHYVDQNRDGRIGALDITNAVKKLGISLTRHETPRLVKCMDRNWNLAISFDEWRNYLFFHPSLDLEDIYHYWRQSTLRDIEDETLVPDNFTRTKMQTGIWWRHLVAGGIAGAISRTSTAPLDRLKVFLQVKGAEFASVRSCFVHMLHEGGVHSLWRGNGINVLKITPESALKFMAYEQAKQFIQCAGNSNRDLGILERFMAGSVAGGISQTIIYPLEVLKTRLALRNTGQYYGIPDAAKKMYNSGGINVFYRGYVPNLFGILPYAGIDLAVYETLKKMYLRQHFKQEDPGILVFLACGTISSSCGQIASYPFSLVKTKLQAQEKNGNGMISMFRSIIQHEGLVGLYRGITPNFMKVAPAVSINYVVYEHVRKMFGVSMT
ncbi:calcium-binding mitochondrial carrier protein SCaMC-2-like [Limulus polyphemus]|uniref:Calcium-binding mitochondrial carrier protein SCaMC-2-like n=1 Tax=Limulus polyphemus TaxID=6850 RepID=A0ABM1AZQ0_LIMPO|nr:calcium-binding mitochondrial carrier protein SCaMC-2-like [Limulus polyphemus]